LASITIATAVPSLATELCLLLGCQWSVVGGRRQYLLNSIVLSSQVPTSCAKSLDHVFRKLLFIVGVPSPHWLLSSYGYCMSHFCGSVVHCNLVQCALWCAKYRICFEQC